MVHSTRKSKAEKPVGNGFTPSEFININLEDAQREALKASKFGEEEFNTALNIAGQEGYRLTVRYDEPNDSWAAWLVPPLGHKHTGMILAGRGSSPMKAVKQLLYIHFKLLDGDWGQSQRRPVGVLDD